MKVRTRFAPSPTGFMHLGGVRTALYAYLLAKSQGGRFILRIEDTDQARYVEGATEVIFQTLARAGLRHDEGPDVGGDCGPYVQSERRGIYAKYAHQLVESGHAYYCFCDKPAEAAPDEAGAEEEAPATGYDGRCRRLSPEEVRRHLEAGDPYVIRQKIDREGTSTFTDLVFGEITIENKVLDDQILLKRDGMPTYNFANVIDDHLMGITHVMRGMEYLSSTPKYNLLYEAFGWEKPMYVHLTTIMRDATHKLSKRDGDATFEDLVNAGFLPEAIINYLALVGWNPGDEREFFTLDELKEAFSLEGLSKSPAIFDHTKLRWMNAEYIRRLTPEEYIKRAEPYLEAAGVGHMDKAIFARILQPRTEVLTDITGMVGFLAHMNEDYELELFTNKKSKTNPEVCRDILADVVPQLKALPEWTETALHDFLMNYAAEKGMKNGTLLWPVRIAMSGQAVTPGGAIEIAALLGRDEALRRLELGLNKLQNI